MDDYIKDFKEVISKVQALLTIESPLAGAFSETEATNTESIKNSAIKVNSSQKGSLLLELLIAISVLAVVLSVGTQAVYVSMQSGKTSAESDVAIGLANETLEAVRGTAEEKWQNVYDLTGKGSTHYKTVQSAGKWTLVAGDEAIALNTANYTRYVIVNNVSRDLATRAIETTYNSAHDDPSTQQAIVTVSWQGTGSPVVISDYFFRFRNIVCPQTSWTGASSGVKNCSDTTYDTKEAAVSTAGGTLQLQ